MTYTYERSYMGSYTASQGTLPVIDGFLVIDGFKTPVIDGVKPSITKPSITKPSITKPSVTDVFNIYNGKPSITETVNIGKPSITRNQNVYNSSM